MRVATVVGYQLRHDDLTAGIHSRLRVVALNKTIGTLHDPAFRIGKILLGFLFGNAFGLGFMPSLLRIRSCCRFRTRFGLQFCFGLLDLFQAFLLVGNPIRQFISSPVGSVEFILFPVDSIGFLKPPLDLRRQILLGLLHTPIAHRLVFTCIRSYPRPIQCHMPQLHQSGFFAQSQHLFEQSSQRFQVPLPFARVVVAHGTPISVLADLDDLERERWRCVLEQALVSLTREVQARAGESTGARS